jgi:glucosylceramidase
MKIWANLLCLSALLFVSGCGGGSTSTPPQIQTAATPSFTPAGGTFTSAQTITLSDSTSGATIYYTLDGSSPTTSSSKYSSPLSIAGTTTVNALAAASGYDNSAVGTATYTINLPAAPVPQFSVPAGTYATAQSVELSDTVTGATIYYTTDATTPTTSSTAYSTPIGISATTTVKAIAAASGYATSSVASATYTIGTPGPTVSVVLSTHDQTQLLAPQTALNFASGAAQTNQVIVDETLQFQTIEGFGAAFTDSATYLLEDVAQPAQLTSILSDLFTTNGNGIGLSFMRDPMGASDLARSVYSFDDVTTGQTDPNLTSFSIAHDQTYTIPLILQAKTLNPQMKLMSNPWSPPAWMKTTDTMLGGDLNAADYTAYANYFVKYLQAYQAAGVTVDYITLENEPLNNTTAYPSMYLDAPTELTVLRDYVLPALSAANLATKVFVYDHNWDTPSYPATVLSDPTVLASAQVAGTAWHGYGGPPGAQQNVANQFPTKGNWETEHSGGTFTTDQFTTDFVEITLVLRNASKSFVKWSLALDQNLGPNLSEISGAGYGGCNDCTPLVTVNSSTGAVTKDIEFYTLGQYSKYILPGAVRVWSSDTPTIVSAAFVNTNGTRALVAFNNSTASQSFQVQWGTQNFSYSLPAFAAATFTWSGTQTGIASMPATQQIQGASYSTQSGLETEETGDATGSYDLGYITAGAYAVYPNVSFASALSQVNVRAASGGGGGTVKFYLDSMTGTPIATATVAPTGGWQTWTTVNAPVTLPTGAFPGTHTVYAVFGGSNSTGIINMNWFQFQ